MTMQVAHIIIPIPQSVKDTRTNAIRKVGTCRFYAWTSGPREQRRKSLIKLRSRPSL